jgi:hypothetical protein
VSFLLIGKVGIITLIVRHGAEEWQWAVVVERGSDTPKMSKGSGSGLDLDL